jgi:predicted ATPase/DNA-binding SARP family transcriptional activator
MRLALYLLGAFEAFLDGKPLSGINTDKARALLIYLTVESNRAHRRQALAGLLWPDYPEEGARANLRHALANLRAVLGERQNETPFLLIEGDTLQLNPKSDTWVDVAEFERMAAGVSITDLELAVDLYKGGYLEGFSLKDSPDFDNWTAILRERCLGQASATLGKLAEAYEQGKEYEKAIGYSRRRLELEHWQEEAHRQLMRLLALSGQRASALAQYETCRKALKEELGVEPSIETRRLQASIRDGGLSGTIQAKPRLHNLPAQVTSFVGREKEIAEIEAILGKGAMRRGESQTHPKTSTRLVTLTGPGGSGKTRLSLQIAEQLLDDFPDGVWLVELAPLSDPELVVQTAARRLGMRLEANPQALSLLQDYLETKHLLLILDNCEHLVAACAHLANTLLKACPHLHILSSSREALGIEGESSYSVPPLSFPKTEQPLERLAEYESLRLFVERAGLVSPGFQITTENALAVLQICQQLDGIPLAIELAAARVKVLRVEEIASRLDDRFRLLTGGSRLSLPRYQTLRASIDWSYDLLSLAERRLLQRLSVFTGEWVLEAAEYVGCGEDIESCEVLDLMSQLVNKSLVTVEAEARLETRYRMLETIRQYAQTKLVEAGESEYARDRHLVYFAELAEMCEGKIRGPDQAVILNRLKAELDNLRLALEWSLKDINSPSQGNTPSWVIESGLQLAAGLKWFWYFQANEAEGLEWLQRLLSCEVDDRHEKPISSARAHKRAKALHVAGYLASNLREDQKAVQLNNESRILFQDLGSNGKSGYAYALLFSGCVKESLAIFKEIGDKFYMAECLTVMGNNLKENQEYIRARMFYEESLGLKKEISDQDGVAWNLFHLGEVAFLQNDYEKARILWDESRVIIHCGGNEWAFNEVIMNLGILEWVQGNYEQAAREFSEVLCTGRRLANIYWINIGLSFLGRLALSLGNYEEAEERYEEELVFSRKHGYSYSIASSLYDLGVFYWSVEDYERAEERFTEGLAIARKSRLNDEDASHVFGLGRVAFARGEHNKARVYFKEILGLRLWPRGSFWDESFSILEAFAFLEAAQQHMERATRLLGVSDTRHKKWQNTRTPRERAERESAISAARRAMEEEAFALAWAAGQAMTLEQAVEYSLEEHE